jgi:putative sigma-54 modulation protein
MTIPIEIRSTIPLEEAFEERIRAQLSGRLGHGMGSVESATVRFDDINGPKGGVDTVCRIMLVVSGRPSVITEKRDTSVGCAFARAVHAIALAIARAHDKRVTARFAA